MGGWAPAPAEDIALGEIQVGMVIRDEKGARRWFRVIDIAPASIGSGTRGRSAVITHLFGRQVGRMISTCLHHEGTQYRRRLLSPVYRKHPSGGWYVVLDDRVMGLVIHSATAREWIGYVYVGRQGERRPVGSHPTRDGARDLVCTTLDRC
jgi:hypothetical protein